MARDEGRGETRRTIFPARRAYSSCSVAADEFQLRSIERTERHVGMTAMRAAVFEGKNRIAIQERPAPCLRPSDAIVKVTLTTICGTRCSAGSSSEAAAGSA